MRVEHVGLKSLGIAAFVVLCCGIFAFFFRVAGGSVDVSREYRVHALLPNAAGLVPHSDVLRAGVKVGTVRSLRAAGRWVDAELELRRGQAPIYRDATVQPRIKTPAGEGYLDLRIGSPRAGRVPDGGTLPLARAQEAVQLEQVLSTLDGHARARLRGTLRALAGGLAGSGRALGRTLDATAGLVAAGAPLMRTLSQRRQAVARLTADTGTLMDALADRTGSLRVLVRRAKVASRAVAQERGAFEQGLEQLGPTLTDARSSVRRLSGFSRRALPVLRDLRTGVRALTPVVDDLPAAGGELDAVARSLTPFLRRANPLADRLRGFAKRLQPVVGPLRAVLREANPAVAYVTPYRRELGALWGNLGAAISAPAERGWVYRGKLLVSQSTLGVLTPEQRAAIEALLDLQALQLVSGLKTNAYPAPGTGDDPQPFNGDYPPLRAALSR